MFLGKKRHSHSAPLPPGVKMEFTTGVTLRWTSTPSRGSRNTPSHYMLRKPDKLRPDGPLGLHHRLYLPLLIISLLEVIIFSVPFLGFIYNKTSIVPLGPLISFQDLPVDGGWGSRSLEWGGGK